MGATPAKLGSLAVMAMASALALAGEPPASTIAVPAAARAAPRATARALDLSLPPLRLVLTPQQLAELTTPSDDGPMEDVTVSEPPYVTPVPKGQVRALTWALLHPLDAWRILAPITSD